MSRRARAASVVAAVLLMGAACRREGTGSAGSADPLEGARQLVDERRYDEAIELLGSGSDAATLTLLGRAWMGKAETAPLPTPVPGSGAPAAALLKAEERQALGFLERALAARPDHAEAHLALAELLGPHALALSQPAGGVGRGRVRRGERRSGPSAPTGRPPRRTPRERPPSKGSSASRRRRGVARRPTGPTRSS